MGPNPNVDQNSGEIRKRGQKLDFTKSPSRTKQAFANGTKVENILRKYGTVGVDANDIGLFRANVAKQHFGVSDTLLDYQEQLNKIVKVQDYFKSLPSSMREKFRNDPQNMLNFMADPKNLQEAIKMGLIRGPEKTDQPGVQSPAGGANPTTPTPTTPTTTPPKS